MAWALAAVAWALATAAKQAAQWAQEAAAAMELEKMELDEATARQEERQPALAAARRC